jgi:hypothetical protein
MKKTTRLNIGVIATAMVLLIAFSGVALASQPVCPTPETETIRTVTQISCQGMVTEMEKVSWETSNEDLINNPPLGVPAGLADSKREVVGKLSYKQDLKVTDGITKFVKDLDLDTGSDPNLNVMKSMGYTQGNTIGSLSHDEEVGMGIVADWTTTGDVILCPFAAAAVEWLPASCEDVKASSSMVVTDVLATTRTKVGMSESPVSLHYAVTATGSDGAGSLAQGNIAAEFSAYVEDGSAHWTDNGHCAAGDVAAYSLGSQLTYTEKSTANGFWEFSKEMDYTSMIRP